MKSAVEQFLNYLRSVRNASPHTLRNYESDLTQFLTFLAPRAPKPLPCGTLPTC
jgi:site-specific recombinase XerD